MDMDIFGILTMVGGLALFLYGMNTMGDGLVVLSGGKLEQVLERLTNKNHGVAFGRFGHSGDSILVRNNCYGSWFR